MKIIALTHRRLWPTLLAILSAALLSSRADAQPREPVGPFAADVRIALPRFKDDPGVSADLGVATANLPTRGLGLVAGGHWYPVGKGRVTLGLGGELLVSGATKTLDAAEDDPASVEGPAVRTRFWSISPQVSLNFGTGRGWSYLTGGLGWGGFRTEVEASPVGDAESSPRVLNYGGGARWFAKEHVAFAIDLRFYAVNAQLAATNRPAYPSMTLMVFSAGVSFK
jgi:hypothetical protein